MTTEVVKFRAAEAWKMMTVPVTVLSSLAGVEQMTPGVAIDYVQDECDRDDAVTAIFNAAADELERTRPKADVAELMAESNTLIGLLRGESFQLALSSAGTIRFRASDLAVSALAGLFAEADRPSVSLCDEWRLWALKAIEVIARCIEVAYAAYPE